MRIQPVESSAIEGIGYDESTATLRVVFRTGFVYEFYMVPEAVFGAFLAAPSKGSYFGEALRDGPYTWRRLDQ